MIAPAVILIFLFGIFPVGFALYVSMHKWRIKQGAFIGLDNYVTAIDNLAYLLAFALAIGAVAGAVFMFFKIKKTAAEHQESPWLLSIPGAFFAFSVLALINWFVQQLPEVLSIADKVKGLEKTQELFNQLLQDTFLAETVRPAWQLFFGLFAVSILISYIANRKWKNVRNFGYQLNFAIVWLGLALGAILARFTTQEVIKAYTNAAESGTDPGIWPQIATIALGLILLGAAWYLWERAEKQDKISSFWAYIIAAIGLLVGGWVLVGELPIAVAAGSPSLWSGLKVTFFFALFTVPFQLIFSLFISILLFQKLRGSNIFRMIFFLPYVTPAIASAAVFKNIFSNRATAPANLLLSALGLQTQKWLYEPSGIFTLLGNSLGINLPNWAGGPSLALMVIILHSIWTYVGYDTVIYLAGLGNIPMELIDAAEVDGANKWKTLRHIIMPLLSPTTYFLSLIAIIGTFKAFNTIWIFRDSLALGTTDTFSLVIFLEFFDKLRYGYASALAFVLFAIILSLTILNNRIQGSKVFYG